MTIAVINKGQQQAVAQNLQQYQVNKLFAPIKSRNNVAVEPKQKISSSDQPITFPINDDDDVILNRFQQQYPLNQSINSILQNVEANFAAPQPTPPTSLNAELTRPTRVAYMAATVPALTNRYTDDQLDYVRDFAWKLFQVGFIAEA